MLKDTQATPLATLRAPDNSYPAAPLTVNALATSAWDPIFNPPDGGPLSRIATYLDHVAGNVFTDSEFRPPPGTPTSSASC